MRSIRVIIILLLSVSTVFAVVGDWVSYGSQLTMNDLYLTGNTLHAVSHGGKIEFNIETREFSKEDPAQYLEHIDILKYYVNSDSSQWFSYASGVDGISYYIADGSRDYFDFDFTETTAFAGNNEHVLAIYMNDLAPEIAHFVKTNNRYIFQDIYNQFPEAPEIINDIALVNDSLYIATDKGLIRSWLYHANLKPESAWEAIGLDSSSSVSNLFVSGDSLYLVDQDRDLYCYFNGYADKILEGSDEPVAFYSNQGTVYYTTTKQVHDISENNRIYQSDGMISSFILEDNILWLSEYGCGLKYIDLVTGEEERFIPNTMLYTKANSLAITEDNKIAVCGLEGISILDDGNWHDLVFSRYEESIDNPAVENRYYADTLNIAYRVGGQTQVYDAMVSSSGELYCSITDVTIIKYSDQAQEARGPGAFQMIDLNDLSDYAAYDTSNGIIDGTQGLGGGTAHYLMARGVAEDKYGNIWVINAHTLAGETLLKFRPDGEVIKFSTEDSDDKLQILAREMKFDNYGRLWIANEARQSDEPRTTGGITVYDQLSGIWALITTSDGLVSNNVYSIDMDPLTGNMWAATASGVQMIRTPASFGPETEFSMNPPIDGLSGMIPVKLRIDPRGNKWILTQSQGIQIYMTNNRWFDEGNGLSTDNSELLDDVVYDLVFDKTNGYAYLLTASGLNRYEIAWTEERDNMDNVIVFPQPFEPGIDPYIAIDGLADQSQVRISTLDGRVLVRFEAEATENMEKQIVWDGVLPNGEYIPRGVYLAFITNIDGLKATVKFAVK